jgi:pterin-4a-carbinolamine dehydratase
LKALSPDEIYQAIEEIAGWQLVTSDIPAKEARQRTELRKKYEFATFEDAMDFMAVAAGHISSVDHHPRWENTWRTVTVWLCTWAAGHKPSRLDIELAKFLDSLYSRYGQRKTITHEAELDRER